MEYLLDYTEDTPKKQLKQILNCLNLHPIAKDHMKGDPVAQTQPTYKGYKWEDIL